jgi:hypothetical protein
MLEILFESYTETTDTTFHGHITQLYGETTQCIEHSHKNKRSEGPMVVVVMVVDDSSKLPLFDGGGQSMDGNEQVGGNGVSFEEPRERPAKDVIVVKSFSEEL